MVDNLYFTFNHEFTPVCIDLLLRTIGSQTDLRSDAIPGHYKRWCSKRPETKHSISIDAGNLLKMIDPPHTTRYLYTQGVNQQSRIGV